MVKEREFFFKDLFNAPICVFRAFLKISFTNTPKIIYALCFIVFINNGMRWETLKGAGVQALKAVRMDMNIDLS